MCGNSKEIQSPLGIGRLNNPTSTHIMNANAPSINNLESPAIASSQTIQTRPIMVAGQPPAMLPMSTSVSNSNPPIDFTSLQPPPMETTLMSFASSQNQQILQGNHIVI